VALCRFTLKTPASTVVIQFLPQSSQPAGVVELLTTLDLGQRVRLVVPAVAAWGTSAAGITGLLEQRGKATGAGILRGGPLLTLAVAAVAQDKRGKMLPLAQVQQGVMAVMVFHLQSLEPLLIGGVVALGVTTTALPMVSAVLVVAPMLL